MELNKYSFLLYSKEGIISIFSSKTSKEIVKLIKINNNKIDNEIKKIKKLNEKYILFLFQKGLLIYNILLNEVSNIFAFKFDLIDLCVFPNCKKIFLAYHMKKKDSGIIPLNLNFFTQKFSYEDTINNIHNNEITSIKLLDNGNLATGSLDKYMKIWKIKLRKIDII